jgi:hypothetical protein
VRRLLVLLSTLVVAAALGCAGDRAARAPRADAPDAALRAFATALAGGRFEAAHALLSARWRLAYTPRRLAQDLAGAGPAGREAAARALSALDAGSPLIREGKAARLPLGGDRAVVLVLEDGGWKVDALE